jgi:hypothetical protein
MKEYICIESHNEVDGGMLVRGRELIRCKSCTWYITVELKADGTVDKRFKPSFCQLLREYMSENDFCSLAKPKEK